MNGSDLPLSISFFLLAFAALGTASVFLAIKADTIRRAKKESYAVYRSVFEESAAIMLLFDAESLEIYDANPAACDFYGYTLKQLRNLKITDINTIDPTDIIRKMKVSGKRTQSVFRFQHRKASGEVRDVEVNTSPVCIDGRMLIYSIIVDVTEKRYSEERFEAVFRYAPVMMATVSRDQRRFLDVNEAFLLSMGMERRDVIGKTSTEIGIFPSIKDYRDIGVLFEGERQLRNVEFTMLWKDGTKKTLLISADPLKLNGRDCWLASYMDITERKVMEQELLAAKETAVMANSAKSRFVANMSHEIRTPLHRINGFLELLSQSELNLEQQDLLGEVRLASESLLQTMNGLLDFSKLEFGMMRLEETPFQIRRLFHEAVSLFARGMNQEAVIWKVTIPNEFPDWVLGDPLCLKRVLYNLLSNAVKFTERGRIEVMAQLQDRDGDTWELGVTVQDTGIGIAPEALDSIFLPFVQADDSVTRKYGGTGLGLTICKELVRLMGGSITVESKPGAGTSFHFSACLKQSDGPREAPNLPAPYPEDKEIRYANLPLRILLVEDNEVNRRVVVKMLANDRIYCDEAVNGLEALRMLDDAEYDLILMDCQMPVMDGFKATEAIRYKEAGSSRTPVIALTAHAFEEEKQACFASGMDDFISKPFTIQELRRVIGKYAHRPGPPVSEVTYLDQWSSATERLVKDCGITEEEAAGMLGRFLYTLLPELHKLRCSLEQGESMEELSTAIHTLKGKCGTLRLNGLHRLVTDIGAAVKRKQPDLTGYRIWLDRYMKHMKSSGMEGLDAQHYGSR